MDRSGEITPVGRENFLDAETFKRFIDETHPECESFTKLESTTCTIEGYITNVCFFEEKLIKDIEPTYGVPRLVCNYGDKKHESYRVNEVKKSNRGRKKVEKQKKTRKIQGDGTQFGSQLTFEVRSHMDPASHKLPKNGTYKFKVFRNGRLQLPGAKPEFMRDVIECVDEITRYFKIINPIEKVPSLVSVIPVMKNYKYMMKLEKGEMIHLTSLKNKLIEKADDIVYIVKYDREDTRLSVSFKTPLPHKPDKKTSVNIFMKGKINILGAINMPDTKNICEYIKKFMVENRAEIIIMLPSH